MTEVRRRPLKVFEWVSPRGYAKKGDRFQPTGIYRDTLLKQGAIREVTEQEIEQERALKEATERLPEERQGPPLTDRMVHQTMNRKVRGSRY